MGKMVGRKIKRGHGLYGNRRKKRTKGIIAVVLTVIAACALVFLGYSIGEPVINFFKSLGDDTEQTDPWTPPVSETTTGEATAGSTSGAVPGTEAPAPSVEAAGYFELSAESLGSADALKKAVEAAKAQGYTAVVVPLKAQGGALNYKSVSETAAQAGASAEEGLTALEIAETIRSSGMKSVARISVLYDNVIPKTFKSAGYQFENEDTLWLDNKQAKGGKPWLSPFSDKAKEYLAEIADELDSAGFDDIICADVAFPTFRKNDLTYIGASVKDPKRYQALLSVLKLIADGKTPVMLEVSASGVLAGTEEAFQPDELAGITAVLVCKPSEMTGTIKSGETDVPMEDMTPAQRTELIFRELRGKTGDLDVIPCIDREGLSENDFEEVMASLKNMGYLAVMVR